MCLLLAEMNSMDKVVLIACGIIFVIALIVLIWWLAIGRQHFIEKRCPERLRSSKEVSEKDASEQEKEQEQMQENNSKE